MQAKTQSKPLNAFGPDCKVAYVRWVPSANATQTLTDSAGVASVTRSAIGEYVVNFSIKPKAIYPLFAGPIDNSATYRSSVRVESTSATAGTATIKHTLDAANVYLTTTLADISTASSAYVVSPVNGTLTVIRTVLYGTIATDDPMLSTEINGTLVTNSQIQYLSGAGAGLAGSAAPTANNTVAIGNVLEIITDGASTGTAPVTVTYVITPTVGSDSSDELAAAFLLRVAS